MKKIYTTLATIFIFTIAGFSQGYELGIVHLTGDSFKVVAIPNFDSNGNIDASDVGFTLMLPEGSTDVTNHAGLFTGRAWTVQEHDAAFLTSLGLGDGTEDAFQFNLPPGQSIYAHSSGDQIDLVSFDISGSPSTGEMYILLNTDPIAMGAGNVLDSFFNSNIDDTTTQDYFSGLATGMESYNFSTATTNDLAVVNFNYYPNPVKEVLHVTAQEKITQISIYTMLGQEVIRISPTAVSTEINMANLANGTYFIKAQVGAYTGTYKFIKQ